MTATSLSGEGNRRLRRDALRNRRKLVDAVGELLLTERERIAMPLVAERAGLSVATAYRYFPTLDELRKAHLQTLIVELRNTSHDCTESGVDLFEAVVAEWIGLVRDYGSAMAQLRPPVGMLERLREGDDPVANTFREAWERPLRAVMRHLNIGDDLFEHAFYLLNSLLDPREVLDLLRTGMSEASTHRCLTRAYYGALAGWAEALMSIRP